MILWNYLISLEERIKLICVSFCLTHIVFGKEKNEKLYRTLGGIIGIAIVIILI